MNVRAFILVRPIVDIALGISGEVMKIKLLCERLHQR